MMLNKSSPSSQDAADVVFVDDNESFLSAIKLMLAGQLSCLVFSDPLSALSYLNESGASGAGPAVVVVDYSMPQLNGIELCRRLRFPGLRKILLTGQVVTRDVIEAFDEKIIDGYINKSDDNFVNSLRAILLPT